jgi:hypothetical protein
MSISRIALALLAISSFGCVATSAEEPESVGTVEAAASDRCAAVLCAAVACADGYVLKTTPGNCCGTCVRAPKEEELPEGSCNTASDCEGLVHIMCVGSWSCVENQCSYTCETSEPVSF